MLPRQGRQDAQCVAESSELSVSVHTPLTLLPYQERVTRNIDLSNVAGVSEYEGKVCCDMGCAADWVRLAILIDRSRHPCLDATQWPCNEAQQLRLPRALQYTYYCTRTFCAANASTETRTSYLLPRTSCRSTSSSTATRCSTRWHRLPSSGGRATRSRSRSRWRWRRRSSSIRPTRRCSAEPQPTGGLYFGVLLHAFSFGGEFSTVTCTPTVPRSI